MGKYLNSILVLLILVIIVVVCSNYFYIKGQENGWELAKLLVPLEKGEIYLAVEETDANGVSFLTVQPAGKVANDKNIDQRELRFRFKLALNGKTLQEYNDKYRDGKKGM